MRESISKGSIGASTISELRTPQELDAHGKSQEGKKKGISTSSCRRSAVTNKDRDEDPPDGGKKCSTARCLRKRHKRGWLSECDFREGLRLEMLWKRKKKPSHRVHLSQQVGKDREDTGEGGRLSRSKETSPHK